MKNIIFYKTTADFNNTGEVLIYKSLLELNRIYGEVIVNDGPSIQPLFLNRIGIRPEERLSTYTKKGFVSYMILTALKSLFSNQRVYFVTGVGEHSLTGMKSVVKNLAAIGFLVVMRALKTRIVRIGMSMRFGDRKCAYSEYVLSHLVNHYYVRDSISLEYCHRAGIKKCKLAPDLSWGYQVKNPSTEKTEQRKDVYLSFRDFCESHGDNTLYKKLLSEQIIKIVRNIAPKISGQIVFSHQCNEDLKYMETLYHQLQDVPNLRLAPELITLDNAALYYGRARWVMSNRLHVLLLGYKFGAPTVCLSDIENHRKIKGIFQDNGLGKVLLDIHQSTAELLNEIEIIDNKRNCLEQSIKNSEERNRQQLINIFQDIFKQ